MSTPEEQAATQLRNIEAATGLTLAEFAADVAAAGVEGHARIVAFLKERHGLGHGNANLIATRVRELAAGGPAPEVDLLAAQYAGAKGAMRPTCDALIAAAKALGPDVTVVIQKTAVALRRRKQLGVIAAASSSRIALGLNLPADAAAAAAAGAVAGGGVAAAGARVVPTPGAMCSHRVDVAGPADVDEELAALLRLAYERAG